MRRAIRAVLLIACAAIAPALPAQDPATPRTGGVAVLLWHDSPNDLGALAGLARGMAVADLEPPAVFHAHEDEARARAFLARCEREKVACIVALGTRATLLARDATTVTPIVFSAVTNPVASGVVPRWEASPGRLCGNSNWLDRGVMIDAFATAVPELRRLAVLSTAGNAVSAAEIDEARSTLAGREGIALQAAVVGEDLALDAALAKVLPGADALWIPIDFALYQDAAMTEILAAAARARVPVLSTNERYAGRGALLTMTIDYELLGLDAALLVRRVARDGVPPGEVPVGRLSSHRTIVDLGVARGLGRRVPIGLVLRAWRVLGGDGA